MTVNKQKAFKIKISNWENVIVRITSITFILQIIYSIKLWINFRSFPKVPIFENIQLIYDSFSYPILFLLLGLLLLNSTRPGAIVNGLILIVLSIFIIDDVNRMQPWVYLYLIIFLLTVINRLQGSKEMLINQLWIILIGVYFWSGISKLNYSFLETTYLEVLTKVFRIEDTSSFIAYREFGFLIPIIEIAAAILIISKSYRTVGVLLAILTHVFIIYFVSPFALGNNYIVIPWNILMILFLLILYHRKPEANNIWENRFSERLVVIALSVLVLMLPFLNLLGRWDNYLSFNLYSGKFEHLLVLVEDESFELLDENVKEAFEPITKLRGKSMLNVTAWAHRELRTPSYPEGWVLDRICKKFCNYDTSNKNMQFERFVGQYGNDKMKRLNCADIK